MNKGQLIKEYFKELGKKSAEARKLKMGAKGFNAYMKKIGFKKSRK